MIISSFTSSEMYKFMIYLYNLNVGYLRIYVFFLKEGFQIYFTNLTWGSLAYDNFTPCSIFLPASPDHATCILLSPSRLQCSFFMCILVCPCYVFLVCCSLTSSVCALCIATFSFSTLHQLSMGWISSQIFVLYLLMPSNV